MSAVNPEGVVGSLRSLLEDARLTLNTDDAASARIARTRALAQIDDLILPRLADLEAPLLVVVGGPTGAGKSTIVNSILGESVSPSSAIRPTTRRPLLMANEKEMPSFRSDRVLAGLGREQVQKGVRAIGTSPTGRSQTGAPRTDGSQTSGWLADEAAGGGLSVGLYTSPSIPDNMALLDAPDIDSISDANRALATQLLDAADLWLFVTTAARYADAAAWALLDEAAARGVVVGVVLNRVPPAAASEILLDLRSLMASRGLGGAPVFVIDEMGLQPSGLLPPGTTTELEEWFGGIVEDQESRLSVARAALSGALVKLGGEATLVSDALFVQENALENMRLVVEGAYENAAQQVLAATTDGSLLRFEVLERWQDFVGTSDVFRSFEKWFAGIGDRVGDWLRGAPEPVQEVEEEITGGVSSVLVDQAGEAAANAYSQLRAGSLGRELFTDPSLEHETPSASERAAKVVHAWQGDLLQMIREETPKKRQRARALSLGLNTLTVALMLVVFASTGGLLGGELAIAGGSAVLGQKLLETVFGDQAIRKLTADAAQMLAARTEEFFEVESKRFYEIIDASASPVSSADFKTELGMLTGVERELKA